MNRRNFIKLVSGILVGLGFVPKSKTNQGKWIQECQSIEVDKTTTYIQGDCFSFCWNRALSDEERMLLLKEPFAMFKKPTRPILNENHPLLEGLVLCQLFNKNPVEA